MVLLCAAKDVWYTADLDTVETHVYSYLNSMG